MGEEDRTITGGCLCGQLRYEAKGPPGSMGFCCCADCRKASGSGYIGFMRFPARALAVTGAVLTHSHKLSDGRVADRNHCAACGSLVYGGIVGKVDSHTIYAGSLDDPTLFKPKMAIFLRDKPDWVALPPGLTLFDGMPGR
jgi:hypothetical protein